MDIKYDINTKIFSRIGENPFKGTKGIGYEVYWSMKRHGDVIAQIDAATGQKYTYTDYLQKSVRTALQMKRLGIRAGDIITIASYNHLNTIIPFIAAQFIGAITASIDSSMSSKDMEMLLRVATPAIAFVSEDAEDAVEIALKAIGCNCKLVTFGQSDRLMMFERFLLHNPIEDIFRPYVSFDGNETAIILFSSGTTGLSKGVCLSHNFLGYNMPHFNVYLEENIQMYLIHSNLCWISAVLFTTFMLTTGRTHVVCKEFCPKETLDLIVKYKIEYLFVSTTSAVRFHKTLTPNLDLPLKYLIFGGNPISPTNLKGLRDLLPNAHILSAYGMTETGLVICFRSSDANYKSKPDSCGRPLFGMQFKIVNAETDQPLTFHEHGELRIKSPHFMNGYYKRDSADAYDAEGFLKTGDIAFYDEDFCVYVIDRLKEMFKYFSWHIIPAKLEAILESHPDVELAAVIGIPDSEEGNHAMGVVVLNNKSNVTTKELEYYVESQVDERDRLRAGVEIIQCMPLTPSGKIKRRDLKEMFGSKRNIFVD